MWGARRQPLAEDNQLCGLTLGGHVKNMGKTPLRIADGAALGGVSVGTASKALKETGQVREDTRRRGKEAAATLGFVAGGAGRGREWWKTQTGGALTPVS